MKTIIITFFFISNTQHKSNNFIFINFYILAALINYCIKKKKSYVVTKVMVLLDIATQRLYLQKKIKYFSCYSLLLIFSLPRNR